MWTYDDLKTKVAGWLARSNLAAQIDDAIMLFESEYNTRKNIYRKQGVASLTTVADTPTVDLPANYDGMVSFERVGYPNRISVTNLEGIKPFRIGKGEPNRASVYPDNKLLFAPTPDTAYSYEIVYNARLDGLSASTPSNWLIERYPHVYLYGVLSYMLDYVQDMDRANHIKAQHAANMQMLEGEVMGLPVMGASTTAETAMP